jgi:hypothetical protein
MSVFNHIRSFIFQSKKKRRFGETQLKRRLSEDGAHDKDIIRQEPRPTRTCYWRHVLY